jgi:branched-chain amino acid transport system permease protein
MNSGKLQNKRLTYIISGVIIIIAFALLPVLTVMGRYITTLLFTFFIFIILSQSWNLLGGYTGQFNLGIAAYFGTGTLACTILYNSGVNPYLSLLLSAIVSSLLACVIGIPTMRLKGIYFSIATLALAEALRLTVSNEWPLTLYVPASHYEKFSITTIYYLALALSLIAIFVVYFIVHSKLGMALRSIRDDEEASKSIGVNPATYKVLTFIVSSFLTGLAGGLYMLFRGIITPSFQFYPEWTFGPLVATCIGGIGTILGPILGSAFFIILQEVFSQTLGKMHFIVTGIFFILVILFLPKGLIQTGISIRRLFNIKSKIN